MLDPEERRARSREYNRRWREKNRERFNEQQRAFNERHPGRRAEIQREFRERKPERARAHSRKYRATPEAQEIARAAQKRWHAANPGRRAAWLRRRRERLARVATGGEAAVTYAEILLADPCAYCGASAAEIDHIVPVAAGGGGEWSNLTASCKSCNSGKCDRPLLAVLLRARIDCIASEMRHQMAAAA